MKQSLERILAGENPGTVVQRDYDAWYAQLSGPSVAAGIMNSLEAASVNHDIEPFAEFVGSLLKKDPRGHDP